MRTASKAALALIVGAVALVVVDPRTMRFRRPWARRLTAGPASDETVEHRVRSRLKRITHGADSSIEVEVEVDRGCVILAGRVPTAERAHIVQSVADIAGVESVVDLLRERPPPTTARARVALPAGRGRTSGWELVPSDASPARRIALAGLGLGLALAAVGIRGWARPPMGIVGVGLLGRALTNLKLRRTPMPVLLRGAPHGSLAPWSGVRDAPDVRAGPAPDANRAHPAVRRERVLSNTAGGLRIPAEGAFSRPPR